MKISSLNVIWALTQASHEGAEGETDHDHGDQAGQARRGGSELLRLQRLILFCSLPDCLPELDDVPG